METTAVLLVLLAAFLHAVRNLFTKSSGNKVAFVFLYELAGVALIAPWGVVLLLRHEDWVVPGLALVALSGAVHAIYWVTHAKAYEGGDLSLVYPVMRSSPALVFLFAALLLGDPVTPSSTLGVTLVAFGAYAVGLPGLSRSDLWRPFAALREGGPMRMAFLTLLLGAAYSLVDKLGVRSFHPFLFLFLFESVGLLLLAPWVLGGPDRAALRPEWRNNRHAILANGVLSMASYGLVLFALVSEEVGKVVSLRQTSVVFGSFLGVWILKERHGRFRLPAALLIAAGCVLLSL